MTLVLGDIVRTTIAFTLGDGTIAQNIYHHFYTGITGISDQVALDALETWAEDMYADIRTMIKDDVVEDLEIGRAHV